MELFLEYEHKVTEHPLPENHPMHTHGHYEILYFQSGNAVYAVEGSRYPLQPGDLMLMRKSEAHHLVILTDERYERSVVNFDIPFLEELNPSGRLLSPFLNRSLGQFNHYPAIRFPENHWGLYFEKMRCAESRERRLCYLLPLLCDLCGCFEMLKSSDFAAEKDRAAAIIRYINRHLLDELSLGALAERFYLSRTHLNRVFKQSTGSTVWEYITAKRLFLARELMASGEPPSKVHSKCGFQDYSTFFRAYRKQFGVSPKSDLKNPGRNHP